MRQRGECYAQCIGESMRPKGLVFGRLRLRPGCSTSSGNTLSRTFNPLYYTALSSDPKRPLVFSRWACGESSDPRGRLCPAERATLRQRFCRQHLRASCAALCESTESLPWPGALTKGMQAKHSARYADSCGVSSATRRTLPCGSALSTFSK